MTSVFVAMLAAVVGVVAGLVHPLAPFAILIGGALLSLAMSGAFALLISFTAVLFLRPADFFPVLAAANPAKIAALATLTVFVGGKLLRRDIGLAISPANRWVMLLTLAALASCPMSTDPTASFAFFSAVFLKILVLWIMIVNVVDSRKRAVSLQVAVAIFTGILGAYAIYAKLTQGSADLVEETRAAFVGVLGDPNDLAFTLLVALPFSFDAFRRMKGSKRWVFFAIGALAVGGVIATQSRGGLIGLSACLYVWLRGIGWKRSFTVLLVLIALAGAYIYGGINERKTASQDITELDSSSQGRLDAWQAGVRMVRANPVFGVGIDRAADNFGAYAIDPVSWRPKTSHNVFVQVAAETGLVGFIPFIALLIVALRINERLRHVNPGPNASDLERAFLTTQFPALVGALVAGFFLSVGWSWFLYMMLAQSAVSERQWL